MHILLIEDSVDLSANIREFLELRGHIVELARDGARGLQLAGGVGYDAVILDLGLPGLDGLTVCQELRQSSQPELPILVLTARDTEADKLRGFAAGADDYVTKPCSLAELLARLRALAGRAGGPREVLTVADLTFDLRTLLIRRGQRTVTLGPIGMRILEQLMRAWPAVVTREQLERLVSDGSGSPSGAEAALRSHILAIRSAVENGAERKLVHDAHGGGYRLG